MSSELAAFRATLAQAIGEDHVLAAVESTAPYAVDGVCPALVLRPGTQDEVAQVVTACAAARVALVPWGGGTSMTAGNPPKRLDAVLSLERLDRVVEFDADNLCITVEAGLTLARLQALVAAKQEILPLDPPASDRVTLGGLVAANLSGPSRLLHGTARDWVLGLRVVLPSGEQIRCGGRVIKNVTGYDMNKLFIRSFGTLGVITEVTLKLLPMPETRASVLGLFPTLAAAKAVLEAVQASFLLPEAMDLLDPAAAGLLLPALGLASPTGHLLATAFSGSQATVDRQVRDLEALVAEQGGRGLTLREAASTQAWQAITNVLGSVPPASLRVLIQVSVPIGRTAGMLASVSARAAEQGLSAAVTCHAASGLLRAALLPAPELPADAALEALAAATLALRDEAVALGGSLTVQAGVPAFKARVDAWGTPGSGFATMRRIKDAFDPHGLCSPGRFLGGI